jgi:hypothetical protein
MQFAETLASLPCASLGEVHFSNMPSNILTTCFHSAVVASEASRAAKSNTSEDSTLNAPKALFGKFCVLATFNTEYVHGSIVSEAHCQAYSISDCSARVRVAPPRATSNISSPSVLPA